MIHARHRSSPTATEKPADTEAQAKLQRLLPPGYPSNLVQTG
jgi:hypothetical protein